MSVGGIRDMHMSESNASSPCLHLSSHVRLDSSAVGDAEEDVEMAVAESAECVGDEGAGLERGGVVRGVGDD